MKKNINVLKSGVIVVCTIPAEASKQEIHATWPER